MKKSRRYLKTAVIYMFILLFTALPVFSQSSKSAGDFSPAMVQKSMDEFSGNLAKSLPFNASIGLNWSDSYIGKFFPSLPPHFGAGFSVGMTGIELGSFEKLLNIFSPALPAAVTGFGVFPIPGYTIEGRIGGFFLPFDLGFKFGIMPIKNTPGFENLDYFLIGGDIRFSIFDLFFDNKALLKILPVVSLSAGFNHLNGALGMNAGNDKVCKYPDPVNSGQEGTLTVKAPKFSVDWATETLDFKLQVSKNFLIVTPYIGIGLSNGWSRAGYSVKTVVTAEDSSGNKTDLKDAQAFFKQAGINNLSPSGFSSTREFSGFSTRLFGGLSFNIAIIRLDLTGLYNFIDHNYGFSFGTRVQI